MTGWLIFLSSVFFGINPATMDLPSKTLSSPDYNFEVIDRWPYGPGFSVLLDEDHVFYLNGAVLEIGEVDESNLVTWISELILPGYIYTMAKEAERLYLSVDDQGIAVVDISMLTDPELLNLFPLSGRVFGIHTRGDTVYAAMGSDGLAVYDCLSATDPLLLGSVTGFNLRQVFLQDSLLIATEVSQGLIVFDVSDPISPDSVAGTGLSGQHYGLVVDTSVAEAWVCSFDGGVNVVDISEPLSPFLSSNIPVFTAWSVDTDSSFAYVATWQDSIYVVHRSTGELADAYGFDTLDVWPYDISVEGEVGALAGFLGSWWTFDLIPLSVVDGELRGGFSQTVSGNQEWIVWGMQPGRLGFSHRWAELYPSHLITIEGWPQELLIRNDTLYIAQDWAGLGIYSMPGPRGVPGFLSSIWFPEIQVWDVEVDDGYAYLATDSGLIVVDVSDASNPTEVSRVNLGTRALSVVKKESSVYAGLQDSGVMRIDVGSPHNPIIGELHPTLAGVTDMILHDSLVYLAQANQGSAIYDVSNGGWNLVSTIPTGHLVFSLMHQDSLLFMAEGVDGISAWDVTIPSFPRRMGSINTGGEARDLFGANDTVVIADGYDGMMRVVYLGLGVNEGQRPSAAPVRIWPNPFSSTLYFDRNITAALYDSSGRIKGEVTGRVFYGAGLKPGVYFLHGKGWTYKIVKLDG